MARIRIYTNSVLASIISLLGYGLVIVGIALLVSGEVTGGIVMLIIGILLAVWAAGISEKKQFKQWRKDLQAKGLEPRIASDIRFAIQVYNAKPGKITLKYIKKLNPDAAQVIADHLKKQKAQKK